MTDLKKELLRFKDIVDGMIDEAERKILHPNNDWSKTFERDARIYKLIKSTKTGINSIIELAEELEKDND